MAFVASLCLVAAATPAVALSSGDLPSISIVSQAPPDHITAGETAAFTTTIWNAPGAGDALDVVFEGELPASLDWQSAIVSEHEPESCSSGATAHGTLSIRCTFAVLSPSSMVEGIVISVWAETDRSTCGEFASAAFADASNNPGDEVTTSASLVVGCPTVVVEAPVLGGTPAARQAIPDTAVGIGLDGRPMTIPLELLAVLFTGSLGALALAKVRAVRRRRR
jgi:hypothetical protein